MGWVELIALIELVVIGLLGFLLWRSTRSAPIPAPSPAPSPPTVTDSLAIPPMFLSVVNALDVGIVVSSNDGRILFLSSLAADLFGAYEEQARGTGLMTILRDHQADAMVREVLHDGEAREMTMRPVMSSRTLRLRCTLLAPDAPERQALLVIRDVTHISMLERARRDLVANVSHELRTPLASIKLLVETLQSEPPAPIAQRMLGQMEQEVDAVTQLVDELRDLSQIESGRVTLKMAPAGVAPVIEQALSRMRPQADRKELHIDAELEPHLPHALMDDGRVGQVLLNLLHNAVKFTSAKGSIHLRAQTVFIEDHKLRIAWIGKGAERTHVNLPMEHPPGQWVMIAVHDTGIGIPAEDPPRIFERFYKVDRSRTRNAGGTGLGLAIARHLIEGHGGRLWADSVEGHGSVFFFTLPVA